MNQNPANAFAVFARHNLTERTEEKLMKACLQRVREASVTVDQQEIGRIGEGLLVLLGIGQADTPADAKYMAQKIVGLRIFEDQHGKMNRSLQEISGQMLVVSQFTLLGNCRKGRRPSFVQAAAPELAERLYEDFVDVVKQLDIRVATGRFQAEMEVALVNHGPVTLLVESRRE